MEPQHNLPDVLPASRYLQERLQERRARNARPRRVRQSDLGPVRGRDDDIFLAEAEDYQRSARRFDSSPLATMSRAGSDLGNSGPVRRRTPGMRDLNDQMDRLTKENFALKLELDHRRDHTNKLQKQIDAMKDSVVRAERLQEEHTELLRINTQLVEELEKRDKAVEEAMDIICDLEDKIVDFDTRSVHTRPSTAKADSGYAGTETQEQAPPSSPPELNRGMKGEPSNHRLIPSDTSAATSKLLDIMSVKTPARSRREPMVLTQELPTTQALRSVYMENARNLHPVQSFASLLTRREQKADEEGEISSPRLSVLSESSFKSMYSSNQKATPSKGRWPNEEHPASTDNSRQDSINRVSRWMDEGESLDDTPSKPSKISPPLTQSMFRPHSSLARPMQNDEHFQSLNDALSALSTSDRKMSAGSHDLVRPRPRKANVGAPRPTSFAGPIFGDSTNVSTSETTTRLLRTSYSTIVDERSLLDITPAPVKTTAPLEPGVRTAPRQMRSSVELKSAYANNLEFRKAHRRMSSSEGDDEDVVVSPISTQGLAVDYEGYPDGASLLSGTPSRFTHQTKPLAGNLMFDGTETMQMQRSTRAKPRRDSSSELLRANWHTLVTRPDASPSLSAASWQSPTIASKGSVERVTSPRSFNSGVSFSTRSSGPRASMESNGPAGGKLFNMSPARNLGHRTQKLFRRLSGGQLEQPRLIEPRTPWEKLPLPTLTSTPSSEYANTVPKDARRPSTAEAMRHPQSPAVTGIQRPPSSSGRRPSLQPRTETEPVVWASNVTPSASGDPVTEAGLGHPSTRRNSVSQQQQQQPSLMAATSNSRAPGHAARLSQSEGLASGGRANTSKRRGSFKDTVIGTALRSWR